MLRSGTANQLKGIHQPSSQERISNDLGNEAKPGQAPPANDSDSLLQSLRGLLEVSQQLPSAQQAELANKAEELPASSLDDSSDQEFSADTPASDTVTLADTPQYQVTENHLLEETDTTLSSGDKELMKDIRACMKAGSEALRSAVLPDSVTASPNDNDSDQHAASEVSASLSAIKKATEGLIKQLEEKLSSNVWRSPQLKDILKQSVDYLQYQISLIKLKAAQLERYASPHSRPELVDQQLLMIDTAKLVAERIRDAYIPNRHDINSPAVKKAFNSFLTKLATRRLVSETTREDNRLHKPDDEKKQQIDQLKTLLKEHELIDVIPLEKLWKEARADVLEKGRDWAVITSEFTVLSEASVAGGDAADSLVKQHTVKTITTPIGHVLNQEAVGVDSHDSPLSQSDCRDYKTRNVADGKTSVTAGRHSHNTTEHQHAVNAARSECYVDGKKVHSGTRHATISPYHLTQEAFAEMGEKKQNDMVAYLTTPRSEPTSISIHTQDTEAAEPPVDLPTAAQAEVTAGNTTELETLLQKKTEKIGRNGKATRLSTEQIVALSKKDSEMFALLRRQAALNRAREVFVCELTGNPELLQLASAGEPIVFNSISLLTPSPIAQFKHKLISLFKPGASHSAAAGDELTMTEDQLLAWKDLQQEINAGKLRVNGKPVTASINTFTFGVNAVSVGIVGKKFLEFLDHLQYILAGPMGSIVATLKALGPRIDDGLTGWSTVKSNNEQSLRNLLGTLDPAEANDPYFSQGQLALALQAKEAALAKSNDRALDQQLMRDIAIMKSLRLQLIEMWNSESFRTNDKDAYKFVTRLNLLSSMMSAGTAFNCKSGKDRTAQLDIETKQLAFQIVTTDYPDDDQAEAPTPARYRTPGELSQLATFVFYDESRRSLQKLNTGVGGSKLPDNFHSLHENYIAPEATPEQAARMKREFSGMSRLTKS